jgi:hypothetical protein
MEEAEESYTKAGVGEDKLIKRMNAPFSVVVSGDSLATRPSPWRWTMQLSISTEKQWFERKLKHNTKQRRCSFKQDMRYSVGVCG